MESNQLSHVSEHGDVQMVDVSGKAITRREAVASCCIELAPETVARLRELPKGDALVVAQIAGIQAAKRTSELVPLAHPLPLEKVDVDLEPGEDRVIIESRVVTTARTGAEIEALTACSVAALTVYDMVKAIDKRAVIGDLKLLRKTGGKSGDFER